MKNLIIYIFKGILFVSIWGTLMHFAYKLSKNNVIVGFFTPINESTWEHTKLIFFPMLILPLFANDNLVIEYPCLKSAMALGTLLGTVLIPVLFYTYSGILGFNVAVVDILIFYISVIFSFYVVYKATISCCAESFDSLLNILLSALAILFIGFTVFPPNIQLFRAP